MFSGWSLGEPILVVTFNKRQGDDIRSRRSTRSSLQVGSTWEGKKRSIPASSELRSCLNAAVSDCRSKQKLDQLVLSCLFEEQHHPAAYGQCRFHVQRALRVRSSLIFYEQTMMNFPRITHQGLPFLRKHGPRFRDVLAPAMRVVMDLLG